eukprot:5748720-Pleurochrysis_carterae.AAC.1
MQIHERTHADPRALACEFARDAGDGGAGTPSRTDAPIAAAAAQACVLDACASASDSHFLHLAAMRAQLDAAWKLLPSTLQAGFN